MIKCDDLDRGAISQIKLFDRRRKLKMEVRLKNASTYRIDIPFFGILCHNLLDHVFVPPNCRVVLDIRSVQRYAPCLFDA